jgi:hypothetical protein
MRTQDMLDDGEQTDRPAAVRQQISNLVASRPGIASPSSSLPITPICSPLTQETGALLTLARELDFDLVGRTTALGEAILLARQHADPTRPTALLLVTDGRNTSGNADPDRGQARRQSRHPSLYPGVGADPDTFAAPAGDADPSAELDEALLQQLATLGGGRYFRARNRGDLAAINQAIDTLEPSPARRPSPGPTRSSTPGHWRWPGCCSAGQPLALPAVTQAIPDSPSRGATMELTLLRPLWLLALLPWLWQGGAAVAGPAASRHAGLSAAEGSGPFPGSGWPVRR